MEGILLTGLKTASTTVAAKGVEKATEKWGLKGFGVWLVVILAIVLAWFIWTRWSQVKDTVSSWGLGTSSSKSKDDGDSDETQY